ncbi:MAG: hypothetical protein HQK64_13160 [Desulfamplus sp.]|nr:hypothetical protein [Desulfamplus sp.]MBF0388689.1 hypothetical protein [Desulfamplus sp.]
MQEREDYQIVNAIEKERRLASVRSDILAMPAEKALDAILDSPFPAALVQSFPDQDLYFLMHHIGRDDFLPILALASSEQWEYILDVEAWDNDKLNLAKITDSLSLLYEADPQRLLRWTIKEKTEFIEYYLFKNIEIILRDYHQDPSDFSDDFSTIDSVFYFKFLRTKDDEPAESLITNMLNTLADMDMAVLHALLLEVSTIISAETEEEEFRLRNVRLAEKGFLPPHEAIAIYQPLKLDDLKERPQIFLTKPFIESDLPTPSVYISLIIQKEKNLDKNSKALKSISNINTTELFVAALKLIEKDWNISLNLQSEIAFLINSVVSAEKKAVRSKEELEKIVDKTCCYLNLGIELIYLNKIAMNNNKLSFDYSKTIYDDLTVDVAAAILLKYSLKDIFRIASGATITLKQRAKKWHDESFIIKFGLPITFLDEKLLGVVGGLLLDKALFFDNYATNSLYRSFSSVQDIDKTSHSLNIIEKIDKMVEILNPDPAILSLKLLTWKALFLTLWAMNRMGAVDNNCSFLGYSIPLNRFKPFFIQMLNLEDKGLSGLVGKIDKTIRDDFFNWLCESGYLASLQNRQESIKKIFDEIFDEIEEEYGSISPEDIDPKLIYHFIITTD